MSVTSVRRALLVVCLIVCVSAPGAVARASARTDSLEAGIVRAMNQFRAQHGLPQLRQQLGFARAADVHSARMLRENRLAHGAYGKRVRRYVRRVARVGENLAWMNRCDPHKVVRMWARSSSHRHVMLSRSFRRVGVARRATSRACFVTADFGTAR
ncbi:CAP domain-containing protein [Solirubrobacter sp. CPCC 204708]|uniref:CAP domain-containing protein n=1 Tax=Solirubrobacter deserti TaxID=2282478 RepID=A0ABT4RL39_9ACTN|nr:CAP domain-containing protein [Solirubrobacter deserti]MBE2316785.1 CAP domain-containing protein [Solirubrobacter deserti]MDA0139000.1 CAP domain-containing protein [Solirubrobacter deserti]